MKKKHFFSPGIKFPMSSRGMRAHPLDVFFLFYPLPPPPPFHFVVNPDEKFKPGLDTCERSEEICSYIGSIMPWPAQAPIQAHVYNAR
jgi:hypothetical protein